MQMTPAKSGAPTVSIALTSTLINLWSGLAFVPMARFPVYCATQAAIHSETMSLRHQLRSSGVKVVELIPPYVAMELGGAGKRLQRGPRSLCRWRHSSPRRCGAASTETVKQLFSRMNR